MLRKCTHKGTSLFSLGEKHTPLSSPLPHTQSLHTDGRVNARFFAASVIMALNVPSRVPESGVREGSRGVCPLLGGTTILVLRNISE